MPDPAPETALVELRALGFSTRDGSRLLDDVSTSLPAHGIIAIIGANGAGKTTLLRLLAGLLAPGSGEIAWHRQTGSAMVFQRPVILRRSVEDNIRHALGPLKLSATEAERRIGEALQTCRLNDLRKAAARRLSGGEQQRLALARALARKPGVLLLDEPCASLDPQSTAAIEDIIRRTAGNGTCVILVTHDLAQAQRLAGTVLFLDSGKLAEQAPADRFFTDPQSAAAKDYLAGRLPGMTNGDTKE